MNAIRLAKMIIEKRDVKTVGSTDKILKEIAIGHSHRGKEGALQESCLGFF